MKIRISNTFNRVKSKIINFYSSIFSCFCFFLESMFKDNAKPKRDEYRRSRRKIYTSDYWARPTLETDNPYDYDQKGDNLRNLIPSMRGGGSNY